MSRATIARNGLAVLVMAAAINGCGRDGGGSTAHTGARYNLVVVVSDALRQDAIGCYGGPIETPHLDALAHRGILFENAYSTSPWTPPSAVSIFTGNYATSYPSSFFDNMMRVHVPDGEALLAELLAERGYDTTLKNENIQTSLHNCFQGFSMLRGHPPLTDEARAKIEAAVGARWRDESPEYNDTFEVLDHLLNMPDGVNFYLFQWILDPHEPFKPVSEFAQRIAVDETKLTQAPETYTKRKAIDGELNDEEKVYLKARYLAEVQSVDERVGYLWQMLEHNGTTGNTFVVFTADHGELFGEHGLYGHGVNFFEELLRVPLIIAGPGLPEGKRVETPVSLVGLMATLADLLGVDYPAEMQGRSFKRLATGEEQPPQPLYFDDVREHDQVDALLEQGLKLINWRDGTSELYDMTRDGASSEDVASAHAEIVERMRGGCVEQRKANAQLKAANLGRLDGSRNELDPETREEIQKKLRALGYIK